MKMGYVLNLMTAINWWCAFDVIMKSGIPYNNLEEINFDKSGPGVELPEDIIQRTSAKYVKAYEKLTCNKFEE